MLALPGCTRVVASAPQWAEGMENLCRKAVVTGLMVDGGYAEYLCAKASHVMAVPEVLDAVEAAPPFCAGVTVYLVLATSPVRSGQRVAVVGVGGLGHLAVQIAGAMGRASHRSLTSAQTSWLWPESWAPSRPLMCL